MTDMVSPPWRIAAIQIAREGEAVALLQECGLQSRDIRADASSFLAARYGGALLGLIGLETLGQSGLVRSMAVAPSARGLGIARALYAELEPKAHDLGLTDLYALTETAEAFFTQAGFELIDRAATPPAITGTAQFASLCPASAAVMHLSLAKRSSLS